MATLKESFSALEQESAIDHKLKENIKNEVFQKLDGLKLVSDIFDLFTINFLKTGTRLLKIEK